ncbi:MAG: tRNA (5-methylaminomethyl-2-thiouridine)(34)-methyltransferase MnmD [Muribaculaceae bacterium]|nr:tRNA (5-methylaminomethyl-2-thiouridine)(34)-methyltransferase MnmD [Muribaculaceae bacterium]
MKVEIERTADGSPTLYRQDIDEHYHSVKGALAESTHIYVDLGWHKAAQSKDALTVFEVGFGTGLNALLTAQASHEQRVPTKYYAVELYPLPKQTTDSLLPYQPEEHSSLFQALHNAEWNEEVEINPFFTLIKIQGDLLAMNIPAHLDVVYFDAFAPEKQPEMWDETLFRKLYDAMKPGAILTTYCAKGSIRRMLQQIGFLTERLPGPPGGKREVLRATKPNA